MSNYQATYYVNTNIRGKFGTERFYAERPPIGTRVWAHTGDGCVWPATVEGPVFNPFAGPGQTRVRFDDPSHDGETMSLPFRQLQLFDGTG